MKISTKIISFILFSLLASCNRTNDENNISEITDFFENTFESNDDENFTINENIKLDISNVNIFENIHASPYNYKDENGFIFNELFPLTENKKGFCIIESDNINIAYQAWGFDYKIMAYSIIKRNDIYPLGEYIGIREDSIIKIFGGTLLEESDGKHISFINKNNNKIIFTIEGGIVSKIDVIASLVLY
jgi:hypothetical protein